MIPMRPPTPLSSAEDARIRQAAALASRVLPPAIAALVARELHAYENFGYRVANEGLSLRVVGELEAMSATTDAETAAAVGPSGSMPEDCEAARDGNAGQESATLSERVGAVSDSPAAKPHIRLAASLRALRGGYGVVGHPSQATASEVHR